MKTKIKICGITTAADSACAADAGADYAGVIVEIRGSPRAVAVGTAERICARSSIPVIILLDKHRSDIADAAARIRPGGVQLIGDYTPDDIRMLKRTLACPLWKTFRVPRKSTDARLVSDLSDEIGRACRAGLDAVVLDTLVPKQKGGTGLTCDWNTAARIVALAAAPVFLAGGIHPGNAADAAQSVRPAGIDVSSGVEKKPGVKDRQKIISLIARVAAMP